MSLFGWFQSSLREDPPPIEAVGLGRKTVKGLRKRGIVTSAQFYDLLRQSAGRPGFQVPFPQRGVAERAALEVKTAMVLGPDRVEALCRSSFAMPPMGIKGPAVNSRIIRDRRLTLREQREKVVERLRAIQRSRELPTSKLLTRWMTPVRSQGRLGSCTGWGSSANREMLAGLECSPLFAYAMAKSLDNHPGEGSWMHFCFEGFCRWGHIPESDWPYTPRPRNLDISPHLRKAVRLKADGYSDILLDAQDMDLMPTMIKAILAGRYNGDLGPQAVSVSVAIHPSFGSPATTLYGLVSVPPFGETCCGGHAMCCVGYVDADDPDNLYKTDYFVVKNSWGTDWAPKNPLGLPGYGLFPAAYFTQSRLLWEGLVCLAEDSPARGGWLEQLRVAWMN